jgi:hypothetical protein
MLTWLGRVSAAGGSVSGAKLESAHPQPDDR